MGTLFKCRAKDPPWTLEQLHLLVAVKREGTRAPLHMASSWHASGKLGPSAAESFSRPCPEGLLQAQHEHSHPFLGT